MQTVLIGICVAFVLEMSGVIFAAGKLFQKVANLKELFLDTKKETNRRLIRLEDGVHCGGNDDD